MKRSSEGVSKSDEEMLAKLQFTEAAIRQPDPFVIPVPSDKELDEVLLWIASKSAEEVCGPTW